MTAMQCTQPYCGLQVHARGLCDKHYLAAKRLKKRLAAGIERRPDFSERDREMIALFEEGLALREIGTRLGVTKNTVVGRLWRLGISRRDDSLSPHTHAGRMAMLDMFPEPGCCLYSLGNPDEIGFRFCASPEARERPYCPTHMRVAYVAHPSLAGSAGALARVSG